MVQPRRDTNGTAWRKARARVLKEETHCAHCGIEIDKQANWLDPAAPQVDHKQPFSQGGHPTKRSNLQLLCRKCNRAKGDGTKKVRASRPIEPLKTSRVW